MLEMTCVLGLDVHDEQLLRMDLSGGVVSQSRMEMVYSRMWGGRGWRLDKGLLHLLNSTRLIGKAASKVSGPGNERSYESVSVCSAVSLFADSAKSALF
jgi:hypothetical protein